MDSLVSNISADSDDVAEMRREVYVDTDWIELIVIDLFSDVNVSCQEVLTSVFVDDVAVVTKCYNVNHPKLIGLLPAKAFHTGDKLLLVFYYNASLSDQQRAMGDMTAHVLVVDQPAGSVVRYSKSGRMFIDNQLVGDKIAHVIIFPDNEMQHLIDHNT